MRRKPANGDPALRGPATLAPDLGWRSLVDLAVNRSATPAIRRRAELQLEARIDGLTLGERIALARRATRPLFAALARHAEPAVIASLLGNGRCTESDVIRIAADPRTPALALAALSRHPEWGARSAVRVALAANRAEAAPGSARSTESA